MFDGWLIHGLEETLVAEAAGKLVAIGLSQSVDARLPHLSMDFSIRVAMTTI
jgi:hypothetical protein